MRECICPYCGKKAGIFRNMWDMESLDCDNCNVHIGLDFMPSNIKEKLE